LFSEYRTIPGEAKLLVFLNFIPSIAIGLIYTDISYFLTKVQGLTPGFAASVIMVMGITMVIVSVPIGILADRYGRRKFLIIGNLLASLTLTMFSLTTNAVLLFVAAIVEGTTEAAFAAAGMALLAEKSGTTSRTPAFSLSSFLSNIAWGIGGFAIAVVVVFQSFGLSSRESHVLLYFVVAALSVATTPLLLRVSESRTSETAKSVGQFLPRKSRSILLRYAVTSALIALGAGLFVPLMTLWFSLAYGVSDALSGPIIGVSGLLIAVTSLAAPFLARRLGLVRAVVVTQLFSTVFMISVPLSPTFAVAAEIYTVRSFLMNLSNPLISSMIMGLVTEDERGAASGLNAAIWKFPNSISTGIGGAMMQVGLLALPFYLAAALYVASISLFWFFFHRTVLPEEEVRTASPESQVVDSPTISSMSRGSGVQSPSDAGRRPGPPPA